MTDKKTIITHNNGVHTFYLKGVTDGIGFKRYHQAQIIDIFLALGIDKNTYELFLSNLNGVLLGIGSYSKKSEGERIREAQKIVSLLEQRVNISIDFNINLSLAACFWCFEDEDVTLECSQELLERKVRIWMDDTENDFSNEKGAYFFFVMWAAKQIEQQKNLLEKTTMNYLAQMNYLSMIYTTHQQK